MSGTQLLFNQSEFEERKTFFADVLLPLPVPLHYTYRIPEEMKHLAQPGVRTIVQFGKRKIYTGVIKSVHQLPPQKYEAKYLLEILDEIPIISETYLKFYEWMGEYYMCTSGEVLQAALPSGLKLSSESKLQIHPDYENFEYPLSNEEIEIIEILQREQSVGYSELTKFTTLKNPYKYVKSLLEKQSILLYEQVNEKYKPLKEKRIKFSKEFRTESAISELLNSLSKKPGQENVIMGYLKEMTDRKLDLFHINGLPWSIFQSTEYSLSSLNTLIKNQILEKFEVIIPRIQVQERQANVKLSPSQEEAIKGIYGAFEKNKPVLLHGITGSGKTEVYIQLINNILEQGQQVLFLLPEIALTTQIISRLHHAFGNSFGVYHSRHSDNERVEVWKGVLEQKINFVVGVRSSIFLPFQNLGLIIVDEEHETSYKQHQPAPRYHARDCALMLSTITYSQIILGSATPSIESYYAAKTDKYQLIELHERYGNAKLPTYEVIDIVKEKKKKAVTGEFSNLLINAINQTLEKKEQGIIFQNRRGFSPVLSCGQCGWTSKCIQCSVSLTYHQSRNALKCHYCGYSEPVPIHCPDCGSNQIETVGFGTEKLEEELKVFFPEAVTGRMDLDNARTKSSYEQLLSGFESGEIQLLVGTQMLSKGLDFNKVSLVGIVDLDRMLHFPDFRSSERTFQLSVQVGGRAGRAEIPGAVYIQTKQPDHPVITYIKSNNYIGFFESELNERKQYFYPPFSRLIRLTIKHKDKTTANQAAIELGKHIREKLGMNRVFGPEEAMISRLRNLYLFEIQIKLERNQSQLNQIKHWLKQSADYYQSLGEFQGIRVTYDVDPI